MLSDKKYFLERALDELDVMDNMESYALRLAVMVEKRTELQAALERTHETRILSEEMRARAQAVKIRVIID